MSRIFSRPRRRIWVIANYLILTAFIILFLLGEYSHWNIWITSSTILFFILLVISTIQLYVRTDLWKLTHTKTEKLDEREMQLILQATQNSYKILGAFSLLILFFIFLTVRFNFLTITHRGDYSFGLTIVMVLNYLFNIMPASIIAWSEKEVILKT